MASLDCRSSNALSPLGSRSKTNRFARPLCPSRHVLGFVCLVVLATLVSTSSHGQQGLPIVQQAGTVGVNVPSPIFVDANQYMFGASGDACKAISGA